MKINVTKFFSIYLLCIIILNLPNIVHADWIRIGADIDGEAVNDISGHAVSLSADGMTIAIGAPNNSGNGLIAGHVRIFKNINGIWTQVGQDIDGEEVGDHSGRSISLSADGNIIAIGAPDSDPGLCANAGNVRVYQNKSGTWTQVGSDIEGKACPEESGTSVSLSADGMTVAIGEPFNLGILPSAGHVRIYKNISGTWTQIGQDIEGEAEHDYSGHSISLSADGKTVAIGSPANDGNGANAGQVRVYQNISGTWTQIGQDIDGQAASDGLGSSVSLSEDGCIIAIGAPFYYYSETAVGYVRAYQFKSGTWTQIGQDIEGEEGGDWTGHSVSISADGKIIAIGADASYCNGPDAGQVRVYKNIFGTWTQIGQDIIGEASVDRAGSSVSISADGTVVAIGAPWNDGSGFGAGHARVFKNKFYWPMFLPAITTH
jgi:Flp pilus assembly pilin Flp